ncbi:hypothetical protein EYF80_046645 [Liparis tanakae]|uniref:Uncharacterized protein n=1 Tax=Liparis tanakae TaxID=230148 RepID=A0A4Z2FQL4_9TELE|nr:hypothetical protein EYF80_046645 [Liparis tanakae]
MHNSHRCLARGGRLGDDGSFCGEILPLDLTTDKVLEQLASQHASVRSCCSSDAVLFGVSSEPWKFIQKNNMKINWQI